MLAHLRTEAYPVYAEHRYPPAAVRELSYEVNVQLIDEARQQAGHARVGEPVKYEPERR